MSAGAVIGGVIGIAVLDAVLSHRQATANVGAAENGVVTALQRFVDPTVPFFGKAVPASSSGSGSSTSSGGSSSSSGGTPWYDVIPFISPLL